MGITIQNTAGLFEYAGNKYFVNVALYDETGINVAVDNEAIESIEYVNEINNLYLTGSIIINDNKGLVDRLIGKMYPGCIINFAQVIAKQESKCSVEQQLNHIQEDTLFSHRFLVNNIQLIDRKQNNFQYKLQLVSTNIFKLLKIIDYTNYQKSDPEKIFDILKACIKQSGLKFDGQTFGMVKSPVKMYYITNGNDNLISITKYLMNKQYFFNENHKMYYEDKGYDPPRDITPSMKFILYNNFTDKFQLFDLNNRNTFTGLYDIIISVGLDSLEAMQNKENQNFSTVLRFPKIEFYKSLYKRDIYFYDPKENDIKDIKDTEIKPCEMKKYFNKIYCPLASNTEPKMQDLLLKKEKEFFVRESYWNNKMSIYDTFADAILKNDALIINTQGEIMRKPANLINLNIDRNIEDELKNQAFDYKDLLMRYHQIEGTWIVSKVRNIIRPRTSQFRQNLTLFRNYKSKSPS